MRVRNKEVRYFVERQLPFKTATGHLYGEQIGKRYVVFSYGPHFPIYLWKDGVWYGNIEKYSATTTRHQSVARPRVSEIHWKTLDEMKGLARPLKG